MAGGGPGAEGDLVAVLEERPGRGADPHVPAATPGQFHHAAALGIAGTGHRAGPDQVTRREARPVDRHVRQLLRGVPIKTLGGADGGDPLGAVRPGRSQPHLQIQIERPRVAAAQVLERFRCLPWAANAFTGEGGEGHHPRRDGGGERLSKEWTERDVLPGLDVAGAPVVEQDDTEEVPFCLRHRNRLPHRRGAAHDEAEFQFEVQLPAGTEHDVAGIGSDLAMRPADRRAVDQHRRGTAVVADRHVEPILGKRRGVGTEQPTHVLGVVSGGVEVDVVRHLPGEMKRHLLLRAAPSLEDACRLQLPQLVPQCRPRIPTGRQQRVEPVGANEIPGHRCDGGGSGEQVDHIGSDTYSEATPTFCVGEHAIRHRPHRKVDHRGNVVTPLRSLRGSDGLSSARSSNLHGMQEPSIDAGTLADEAVELVKSWLIEARGSDQGSAETHRLAELLDDPHGPGFAMRFVDLVIRPEDDRAAAGQLRSIVTSTTLPRFLGPVDRLLLRIGALLAPVIPGIVLPLARARMRALIGHLIADAEPERLTRHLARVREEGNDVNVNLLGEAVLGDREATKRLESTIGLLERDDVDYVSVKISSIVSDLNLWAFDHTVELIETRLRRLYRVATASPTPKFVNLDMEEYQDLDLTLQAFMRLLDEDEFSSVPAGIVLQAYLPDAFGAIRRLAEWAASRHARTGAEIKVRLVKGANLAMERVDARIHGWEQAPYDSKVESDANYKRCLDWAFQPDRLAGTRIGVASHNLFDVAWALLLADRRGVATRVDFEMLQGMAPAEAAVVRRAAGGLRLYTPVVARSDFDTAISYLFRRLEENSDPENFLSALFDLDPDGQAFGEQERRFRRALEHRWSVSDRPRRTQDRTAPPPPTDHEAEFANAADTDPAVPANRDWAAAIYARDPVEVRAPMTTDIATVDEALDRAGAAQSRWGALPAAERRRMLLAASDALEERRADLISTMIHEASKTIGQADPEVSEAVDFARYYADRALDLESVEGARFSPLGVVAVVPPWNFPVAIPAGGVLAALAAGNGVVFKPAPEVPRCAEVIHEALMAAGIPPDLVQYLRVPDDEVGRHLITHPRIAAVILTGSFDTATLFKSWKPDLRLFAETSGKNAIVVTPNADLDLAAADIVYSAFGHAGQKCSAASLAILVGSVYESDRFRRQIVDAAQSLIVGESTHPATDMTPLAAALSDRLERAFTVLDPGERWLLEPKHLGGRKWTPGIKDGVTPGSWFHQTECFGPVLGLMRADDLDDAIELQNGVAFGLTGGIHSLDADELDEWADRVEVGNAYMNRHTTGAIVRRQPFGGWKQSSVGPGAKAGGPNYVAQFGRWQDTGDVSHQVAAASARVRSIVSHFDSDWLTTAVASDEYWWQHAFGVEHDPTGLEFESNVFRYRPRPLVVVRAPERADTIAAARVIAAAVRSGAPVRVSSAVPLPDIGVDVVVETDAAFTALLPSLDGIRVRYIGPASAETHAAAWAAGVDLLDGEVHLNGRLEMLPHLREQAVSRTRHRFGNVLL